MDKNVEVNVKRIRITSIFNILLIIVAVLIVAWAIFSYFMFSTNARRTLREAKNVLLAFDMLTVEFHGSDGIIYDPDSSDGMAKGVIQRVRESSGAEGRIILVSFDKKSKKVRCFTYEKDNYRVVYTSDSRGFVKWDVDYIYNVMSFEGTNAN